MPRGQLTRAALCALGTRYGRLLYRGKGIVCDAQRRAAEPEFNDSTISVESRLFAPKNVCLDLDDSTCDGLSEAECKSFIAEHFDEKGLLVETAVICRRPTIRAITIAGTPSRTSRSARRWARPWFAFSARLRPQMADAISV